MEGGSGARVASLSPLQLFQAAYHPREVFSSHGDGTLSSRPADRSGSPLPAPLALLWPAVIGLNAARQVPTLGRRSQVVRQRSAKPRFTGSNPVVASPLRLTPGTVVEWQTQRA